MSNFRQNLQKVRSRHSHGQLVLFKVCNLNQTPMTALKLDIIEYLFKEIVKLSPITIIFYTIITHP